MLSDIFAVLRVPWIPGVCFSTLLSDKGGILRYISSVESFKKYISNSIKTLPNVFQLKQHFACKSFYCCRLSVNFHCCDKEGLQISTVRPPFLAFRLSRQRLLPTCLSLELLSICSHFWKRKYSYWSGKAEKKKNSTSFEVFISFPGLCLESCTNCNNRSSLGDSWEQVM